MLLADGADETQEKTGNLLGEGASTTVAEDCGHLAHEECPQDFLRALNDFIASLR